MPKGRVSRIDTDFEHTGRPKVIEYIRKKYNIDNRTPEDKGETGLPPLQHQGNVCRIMTFGTDAAKMVIKDVGKVLGRPVSLYSALAAMIPNEPKMTLKKALEVSPDFKAACENPQNKEILDLSMKLEGIKRHSSLHACGLVIGPSDIYDYMPASKEINEDGEPELTAEVIMTEVEELSLIKMDLLGLKNMTVIHQTLDFIKENYGIDLDYHDIPMDDRETLKFLAAGNTGGVFQLESPGMTDVIVRMLANIDTLPDSELEQGFERLIAAVALYRPGPMAYIDDYIEGMLDPSKVVYDCEEERSILSSTYGQIVYQEEVMQIVQKLAGYTLGRADLVRKAMGKKKVEIMAKEREVFIYGNKAAFDAGVDKNYVPGCINNGISEEVASKIWDKMADFAKYAFNRSHAACYAYIAMITAYLSCHYPNEFYAAMLNAFNEVGDKFKIYLGQAVRRGLKILPPDINKSGRYFTTDGGNIRFGLCGIQGMLKSAQSIMDERSKNGEYKDFQDLFERIRAYSGTPINKTTFEGLLYSGALDSFGNTRKSLANIYPMLVDQDKKESSSKTHMVLDGQVSMFDDAFAPGMGKFRKINIPELPEFSDSTLMSKEFECIGFYLSSHPADFYEKIFRNTRNFYDISSLIDKSPIGASVETVGLITDCRVVYTKNGGNEMILFKIQNRYDELPCVIFSKNVPNNKLNVIKGQLVKLDGRFSENDFGKQLIVNTVINEESMKSKINAKVVVEVHNKAEQDTVMDWAKTRQTGNYHLYLKAVKDGKEKLFKTGCCVPMSAKDEAFMNNANLKHKIIY